jgi:hypothetical protein
VILMICETFEDILKRVEFEGSEASFCEFESLGLSAQGCNGGAKECTSS